MNIFETFANNLVDEAKTFPLSETASITMMPVGGDKGRRAFNKMMEPYAARLQAGGTLTEAENEALSKRFYAEFVVVGWEGINDADNQPIPHSVEAAKTLFNDKRLEGFFSLIVRMSQNEAAFRAQADENDSGN